MDEQIIVSVSHSGSESDTEINNMSDQVTEVSLATELPLKRKEVEVPHSGEFEDAFSTNSNPTGAGASMGALANAAADEVEEVAEVVPVTEVQDIKRPGEMIEEVAAKRQKLEIGAVPDVWGTLLSQVRGQLRAMSSDECFSRALELQMLARTEVGSRSQHLSNAMDLMASTGPAVPERPVIKVHGKKSLMPNLSLTHGQGRITKAQREVSKQKPIKTTKAAPVPCMKMTPPLPPRCEVDNAPDTDLPAFCQLVNFPTARYYGNCVMCDESEFVIPKQNKGVCNNCDVAIWVVNPSGMNIKWCKGCKNFRKWIDFGVKGYSSKCERCRCQQAARYANQKGKVKPAPQAAPSVVPAAPIVPLAPVGAESVAALDSEQLQL